MSSGAGGDGNLIPQRAGLVNKGGVAFFHAHGTASATDIASQAEKFLDGHQLHIFVPGGLSGLFQIQLAADGNAEHVDARLFAPGDQRLENLFFRHSDGLCGMDAAQIPLVEFIKRFAAGDSRLLNQTDCVRFCSHIITTPYYTTKRSRFQV